ncbi:MAG: hypothetical protein AAB391_01640 [Patescibacteria group bacterium]
MSSATDSLISKLAEAVVNPVLKLAYAVAFLVFLWGVFQYVRGADNEDARALGVRHMTWGVVGLAIMVTAKAIVSLIGATVGVSVF